LSAGGEDRLTPADVDHLRAYLPPALVEALQSDLHSPPPALLERCAAHLAALLQSTAAHLPAYLVERVARDPVSGQAGGQFVDGTLLFADISGFTAMSESLSRIGREGAEEITTIVNGYFNVMLGILRERGGQLIKLGGDALLGLFLEPGSAARAVQTALNMQAAMTRFARTRTSQGEFPLYMKVGLRKGRFFAAQLGTAQGMQYALFGADVNATAATESAATAGQVLVDAGTHAALGAACRAAPGPEGYVVVEQIEADGAATPPAPLPLSTVPTLANLRRAVQLLDALTLYLPIGALPRLAGGKQALELEGEHRRVAVLFANVHGLGEIADRLGPERKPEIAAALNRYFVAMDEAVRGFGGVINKMDLYDHGDKLLAFFGAPVAHEDDAERAGRAALAMQAVLQAAGEKIKNEVSALNLLPADFELRQHIGLSYGYVFAGYVGGERQREYTVMGDEVNLAARLMSVAEAGSVTVSQSVRRKAQALFEVSPRGTVRLKGKSAPVPIFAVTGLRVVPEHVEGLAGIRSSLVGREAEWRQLLAAIERLAAGRGQIVSITGEAGLGKSRLAAELRQHLARQPGAGAQWVEARCLSYTEAVSFFPMRELVRQLLGVQPDDSETEAWSKARRALMERLSPDAANTHLPYLAHFLNLPLDVAVQEKVRYLDAEALQKRTFIAIRELIGAQAWQPGRPLVLALDDIHWIDQASAALLEYLLPLVDQAPLMLLLLYRPERESACWAIHEKAAREFDDRTSQISLGRMSAEDSQQLLANLVPLDPWPPEIQTLILGRTEGNPLYMEELLRGLVDAGILARADSGWRVSGNLAALEVPDTLEGVMMARLDRLGESCRHATQVASVVGRRFQFDLLTHALSEQNPSELNPCLSRVQQQEIVREAQRLPDLTYAFRHGLMQEVCYGSLLARTRRLYHRKIAAYLEANQAEAEGDYPLIAHHAFLGQDWPRALRYQQLAGEQAQQLFANHEAIDHFTKALQSAENLPPEETAAARLAIHLNLGELLTTTGKYDQAVEHLDRALALADARGERDARTRACRWRARLHELRGEYPQAFEWIERGLGTLAGRESAEMAQLLLLAGLINIRQGNFDSALTQCQHALQIAERLNDVRALARANNLLGLIHRRGDSAAAIGHFRRALDLYQRAGDVQGQATAQNLIANACFNTGQWQEADRLYRQARATFDQMGDVYNRAFADNNLGGIALNQGRLDEALAFYGEALRSLEQIGGSAYVLGVIRMNLGAAFIRQGEAAQARAHLRAARQLFEQAGSRDFLPELHRHFARAALIAGEAPEAEAEARAALQLARELSMRGEEGNCLRVLGEIAGAQRRWDEAETLLAESVAALEEVADEYELARSRFSLARAQSELGKRQAARAALARSAEVFTRLEAAMDLQAALALRESLSTD
jgi:class 3 adenylate cyclase/tetratricopeptide (TPR) repeat protein